MKILAKPLLAISLTALIFFCSGPRPTGPGKPVPLQEQYQVLANSLMLELEQFRGKPFKRDITVALYTTEQYRALVAGKVGGLTEEEKRKVNAVLARENLLHPGMDYFAGYDSAMASMVGGFYQFGSDTVTVVTDGNRITYSDSVSLFHELVHAMQDQYFDLAVLKKSAATSDEDNSLTFVIEGEAELFSVYYQFKLVNGQYPTSSSLVVSVLQTVAAQTEATLDSLHSAGEPLLIYEPFYWAYFPYGPLFVNQVSQGAWSAIDNKIFASLPIKTREVILPSRFLANRTEYLLDMTPFLTTLDSTQIVDDMDELGYVLMHVMFREWDNYSPGRAPANLAADNIIAYHSGQDSTLRMVWYTKWDAPAGPSDFVNAYTLLVNKKRNITLAAGSYSGNMFIINDTVNRIYLEQADSTVIVMEDYLPQYLNAWLDRLHATQAYLASTPVAKKVAQEMRNYPRIDKNQLVKDFIRRGYVTNFHR